MRPELSIADLKANARRYIDDLSVRNISELYGRAIVIAQEGKNPSIESL